MEPITLEPTPPRAAGRLFGSKAQTLEQLRHFVRCSTPSTPAAVVLGRLQAGGIAA